METDSPVVYHGTSESRFPPEEIKKKQIQLSKDELSVLRECNKESFYYRCLPFALAGMAASYLAVKQGYLKAHPKWGAAGKMTGAAFIGWFLGKFSYRKQCEDKFLKLKHSTVADVVRRGRGLSISETFDSEDQKIPELDLDVKSDNYSSYGNEDYQSSNRALNLDEDKNVQYTGLDDIERPSTDRENLNFDNKSEPTRQSTSYEELRRKNRGEYDRQQSQQYLNKGSPDRTEGRQSGLNDEPPRQFSSSTFDGGARNEYGDSWDNPKFT